MGGGGQFDAVLGGGDDCGGIPPWALGSVGLLSDVRVMKLEVADNENENEQREQRRGGQGA